MRLARTKKCAIIKQIKQGKKMEKKTKKKIKKIITLAAILSLGVSSVALMHNMAEKHAPEFMQTQITIGKDTISMQEFYTNLHKETDGWIYTDKQGKEHKVDSLCDYRQREKQLRAYIQHIKLKRNTDTIVAERNKDSAHKGEILYKYANGNITNSTPSMGSFVYDSISVRKFVSQDSGVQAAVAIFNNEYNCTYAHEYQHYLNQKNGLHSWNSYRVKFVEVALDEISANIAQCVAQRKNYIERGKNIDNITNRFALYKEAIQSGEINPTEEKISPQEQKIIAQTVFDTWMREKYGIYVQRMRGRTKYYLQDAPYQALKEDKKTHNKIMNKIFNIGGYNFWQYISHRENEIFDSIPEAALNEWKIYENRKLTQMKHLDKLEQQRQEQGKIKYMRTLRKNWFMAKMISMFGKSK